jgi:hypothetical protein
MGLQVCIQAANAILVIDVAFSINCGALHTRWLLIDTFFINLHISYGRINVLTAATLRTSLVRVLMPLLLPLALPTIILAELNLYLL